MTIYDPRAWGVQDTDASSAAVVKDANQLLDYMTRNPSDPMYKPSDSTLITYFKLGASHATAEVGITLEMVGALTQPSYDQPPMPISIASQASEPEGEASEVPQTSPAAPEAPEAPEVMKPEPADEPSTGADHA